MFDKHLRKPFKKSEEMYRRCMSFRFNNYCVIRSYVCDVREYPDTSSVFQKRILEITLSHQQFSLKIQNNIYFVNSTNRKTPKSMRIAYVSSATYYNKKAQEKPFPRCMYLMKSFGYFLLVQSSVVSWFVFFILCN